MLDSMDMASLKVGSAEGYFLQLTTGGTNSPNSLFGETELSECGLFWTRRYQPELNWTELNWIELDRVVCMPPPHWCVCCSFLRDPFVHILYTNSPMFPPITWTSVCARRSHRHKTKQTNKTKQNRERQRERERGFCLFAFCKLLVFVVIALRRLILGGSDVNLQLFSTVPTHSLYSHFYCKRPDTVEDYDPL